MRKMLCFVGIGLLATACTGHATTTADASVASPSATRIRATAPSPASSASAKPSAVAAPPSDPCSVLTPSVVHIVAPDASFTASPALGMDTRTCVYGAMLSDAGFVQLQSTGPQTLAAIHFTPRGWVENRTANTNGSLTYPSNLGAYAAMRYSSGESGSTGDVMWVQGDSTYDVMVYSPRNTVVPAASIVQVARLVAAQL